MASAVTKRDDFCSFSVADDGKSDVILTVWEMRAIYCNISSCSKGLLFSTHDIKHYAGQSSLEVLDCVCVTALQDLVALQRNAAAPCCRSAFQCILTSLREVRSDSLTEKNK